MAFTEEDAAKDAARDILLARILSLLANTGKENPLRWLDREQVFVDAVISSSTGTVERGGQSMPMSDAILSMIRAHLEEVLGRARSLQTQAARDHYQQKLTIEHAHPHDE